MLLVNNASMQMGISKELLNFSNAEKFTHSMQEKLEISSDRRAAVIMLPLENNCQRLNCSKLRRIALLSIAGNILTRVFLNRFTSAIAH